MSAIQVRLLEGIQAVGRRLGLNVTRFHPEQDKWLTQARLLAGYDARVILDVGANIGQSAQRYAGMFERADVHAFEPFPQSYQALMDIASAQPRIIAHQLAISDARGQRPLYENPVFHATSSLLPRPSEGQKYFDPQATLTAGPTVRTETLDDFIRDQGIEQIDILKLDIQGAEALAIQGAHQLLSAQRVGLIQIEVMFVPHYENGPLFAEIHHLLSAHGYSLFGLYDLEFAAGGQLRFADAIFVNQSLRARRGV